MNNERAIPIRVDIVSDVVCPWCIIGYKQFMRALDTRPGEYEVSLRWHPYELNPAMPAEGQELKEHVAEKYGATREQSQANRGRLTTLGDDLGFTFDYFEGMRIVNTFDAHQLLHWAGQLGEQRQTSLKLRLFSAFFSERKDVSDREVLVATAAESGLDAEESTTILEEQRFAEAVRLEQNYWREREVYAVPTFIFEGSYPVPGAQDASTFARVLDRIRERKAA
ncbi:MAG: DsbA family oxidoreductase [Pseudomonadota bacterium]